MAGIQQSSVMKKNRLEAFSDGVLAIIITIMVLEIRVPQGDSFSDLLPKLPIFLSYILSFVYVGIYWNNHHHMIHAIKRVNGKILLVNLNLLFWLSLIPFASEWVGGNHFSAAPTALYGVVLLISAVSYKVLQTVILRSESEDSLLAQAVGRDVKGWLSLVLYVIAIALSNDYPGFSHLIYALVAVMWVVPNRRIESLFSK
jgi:uncharacterized membrane protein